MVRLGIGLYGIDPSGTQQNKLETVFTLKTSISQIKTIAANESVGYARKAIENRARKIAVLAIGYADGLNRLLSNGKGSFLINGKQAPIVGNVCMDMCMVDVSNVPCNEGDEAILFGREQSILDVAKALQTIPYEVLTAISQRVKRVYVSE
jgi:alanine racemase